MVLLRNISNYIDHGNQGLESQLKVTSSFARSSSFSSSKLVEAEVLTVFNSSFKAQISFCSLKVPKNMIFFIA